MVVIFQIDLLLDHLLLDEVNDNVLVQRRCLSFGMSCHHDTSGLRTAARTICVGSTRIVCVSSKMIAGPCYFQPSPKDVIHPADLPEPDPHP
jgi:hypothetical protein